MAERRERGKIFEQVAESISSVLSVSADNLSEGTSLTTDLVVDSLLMYEIVIELEEIFDARISDNDIDRIETIGDIVDFLVSEKE